MNQLLKVEINENQEPIMSARELHEFLEVDSNYTTWFKRMTEYGFEEQQDYITCLPNLESEIHGGQNKLDHIIKLDMAKEIAMIQRSEKGKQARRYFLQIEKEWNSPEKVMARALKFAEKKMNLLETKILEDRPKVIFADAVSTAHTSILIGDLAKLIKQNGVDIGQKRLFAWLRDNGYLIKRLGADHNMPMQKCMEMGLFDIKETAITHSDGHISVNKTVKATGKGQQYFINKFLGNKQEVD